MSAIDRLEAYQATTDTFSVIVVGRDPTQRLRITNSAVEPVPPAAQP